ncbi:hypothetical protein AB4K20DRAFT_1945156 [Rhizopus microsporus]
MEWVEDVDPFHLETLTTFQKYKQAQPSEQERMRDELDETMNELRAKLINEGTIRISIKDDDYKYLASSIS